MNTIIYLIRHGEIDNPTNSIYGRALDLKLSKRGEEQITRLAKQLKKRGATPVAIYTSPMSRTVSTAKLLQEVFVGMPIIKDEHFYEVSHPGLEKFSLKWHDSIGGDVYTYKGKEIEGIPIEMPYTQAKRMIEGIKNLQKKYPGKTIFIISHGDPIFFTYYQLLHSKDQLEKRSEFVSIKREHYPEKGSAIRLELDENTNVIEHEQIV